MNAELPKPAQQPNLCVIKFGGSVLTSEADYVAAGAEIYRHVRAGEKTIVIVSAKFGETDELVSQADALAGAVSPVNTARLVRIGEFKSAALMGLVLARIGVRCKVFDPHEIGLMAKGDPLDADLTSLDRDAMNAALEDHEALIIPGFTAGHEEHGAVTLGRGGTDLTAVFFASETGANRVRLIKDVDGVYTDDPAKDPYAKRYDELDYATALKASRGLIQEKAIEAARDHDVVIEIAAVGAREATKVHAGKTVLGERRKTKPMKVALLGCGAVGSGVLDHLRHHPDLFEINPVLVRNPGARADDKRAFFTSQLDVALDGKPDLVIEATGGADEPAEIMHRAFDGGAHVVSANKAAIAKHYDALSGRAREEDTSLTFSASVGGGVVMLETVLKQRDQGDGIASIEGVVNGTGNFILSQLEAGADFDEAVRQAQAKGFAEADPTADVDGHDAADKLSLLIRLAYRVSMPPSEIPKQSLREINADMSAKAKAEGKVYKQIARAVLKDNGAVEAEIAIRAVPLDHPFAGARNEENRALITMKSGEKFALFGKGAGRWPTAASVFADIMDVQRAWMAEQLGSGDAVANDVNANPAPRPASNQ